MNELMPKKCQLTQINILWWGFMLIMAGAAMSTPYWPLYLTELIPDSPSKVRYWSALIYLAPFISAAISGPLWGMVGDKFGYKAMLIRACVGLFVSQALILTTSEVWMIFIIRLLQGALAGVIVAAQAWALSISPNTQRGYIIGKLHSAVAIGELSGPLIGGVIANQFGYQAIFIVSSIICLSITIIFLYSLDGSLGNNLNNINSIKSVTLDGVDSKSPKSWKLSQTIYIFLLVITVVQLSRSIFTPFFALYVRDQINGSDLSVGLLYAATALAVFISSPLWGRYFDERAKAKKTNNNIISLVLVITALIQLLHYWAHSFVSIALLRFAFGLCIGGLIPVLLSLIVTKSGEKSSKAVLLGIANSAIKVGNLLGAITGAIVLSYMGYLESFWIMALLYLFAGGVLLLMPRFDLKK